MVTCPKEHGPVCHYPELLPAGSPLALGTRSKEHPWGPAVVPCDKKGLWQLHPTSPLAQVRPSRSVRGVGGGAQVLGVRGLAETCTWARPPPPQ